MALSGLTVVSSGLFRAQKGTWIVTPNLHAAILERTNVQK